MFHGVKRQDWRAGSDAARALGRELAQRAEVAYWIELSEKHRPLSSRAEQRVGARRLTRLRSAKLLDAGYRFVCECRICDRSVDGLRLLLARVVQLPPSFSVHIDETGEVRGAKVVWRRGATIGIRLEEAAPAGALRPSDRHALRDRYYAIPN
jgi:hypothetical protein